MSAIGVVISTLVCGVAYLVYKVSALEVELKELKETVTEAAEREAVSMTSDLTDDDFGG